MLTPEQRRWRADKLGDLATYTAGALIFGQVLNKTFSLMQTLVGIAVILLCFFYADRQMNKVN